MDKIIKLCCAIFVSVTLNACVAYSPILEPYTVANTESGYVYGRFKLDFSGFIVPTAQMGLIIEELSTNHEYTIPFTTVDTPALIRVKPGTYILTGIVYSFNFARKHKSQSFTTDSITRTFTIKPGKAYYIADFLGTTNASATPTGTLYTWRLTSIVDNFESTTEDLKKEYFRFQIDTVRALENSRLENLPQI